jgi:hypothetical protein
MVHTESIIKYTTILANAVVILGAIPAMFFVKNYFFEKKKKEIADNLTIRRSITDKLVEHANGYDRSEPHDIGIRLVYWKHYPWKLKNDGYKQILYYNTNTDKRITNRGDEFLTNTGILLEEHIWFFSESLYIGKHGIFIVDKSGKKIAGFQEITQKIKFVNTLRYKHIINWDFEEKIDYEPVFYTRYKYTDKRLFEDELFAQNYYDIGTKDYRYLRQELNRRNLVRSNRAIKYGLLMLKGALFTKKTP